MTTNDIDNFTEQVTSIVKNWFQTSAFHARKLTDTPTDALQVVNKNYSDTAPVLDTRISFSDNTTGDVSITKHGFAPKAPNDATKFLRGDATWAVPPSFDPTTTSTVVDDFIGHRNDTTLQIGELGWTLQNIGTGGTTQAADGGVGHPGVVQSGESASANNGNAISLPNTSGQMCYTTFTMIWGVQLGGTSAQRHRFGLSANATDSAGGTDGIFFETNNDGVWHGVCRKASSNTSTSSSVAITTGWVQLKIVSTAGTSFEFFVNGVSLGVVNTGIPTADLRVFAHQDAINTTQNLFNLDYFYLTFPNLSR